MKYSTLWGIMLVGVSVVGCGQNPLPPKVVPEPLTSEEIRLRAEKIKNTPNLPPGAKQNALRTYQGRKVVSETLSRKEILQRIKQIENNPNLPSGAKQNALKTYQDQLNSAPASPAASPATAP